MRSGLPLIGRGLDQEMDVGGILYEVLRVYALIFLDSSMVERTAVNRDVVGSSPIRGVKTYKQLFIGFFFYNILYDGPMVKRLRHRPFTAVTRVRVPVGSP